jgi:hypothetical protein
MADDIDTRVPSGAMPAFLHGGLGQVLLKGNKFILRDELIPVRLGLELIWVVATEARPQLLPRNQICQLWIEADLVACHRIYNLLRS